MNEQHVGEAGKHKGHILELLGNGNVYCLNCQSPLTARSADVAWAPENQSVVNTGFVAGRE